MSRRSLYGEDTEPFYIYIPASVKAAIQSAAADQHLSMTQLATFIFKDYLSQLPEARSPAPLAGGNQQEPSESTRWAPALSQEATNVS